MAPMQVVSIRPDINARNAEGILRGYRGIGDHVVDRVSVIRERVAKNWCAHPHALSYSNALQQCPEHQVVAMVVRVH